jgi:hypothetical protein
LGPMPDTAPSLPFPSRGPRATARPVGAACRVGSFCAARLGEAGRGGGVLSARQGQGVLRSWSVSRDWATCGPWGLSGGGGRVLSPVRGCSRSSHRGARRRLGWAGTWRGPRSLAPVGAFRSGVVRARWCRPCGAAFGLCCLALCRCARVRFRFVCALARALLRSRVSFALLQCKAHVAGGGGEVKQWMIATVTRCRCPRVPHPTSQPQPDSPTRLQPPSPGESAGPFQRRSGRGESCARGLNLAACRVHA